MTIATDGTVTVAVGSTALGQGLKTVMSQIAAEALGLPIDRIRLLHGSTTVVKEGVGSFHFPLNRHYVSSFSDPDASKSIASSWRPGVLPRGR